MSGRIRIEAALRHCNEIQSLLRCPICYDQLSHPVTLPCGHTFCTCCIGPWYQTEANKRRNLLTPSVTPKCPTCRNPISIHPSSLTASALVQSLNEKLERLTTSLNEASRRDDERGSHDRDETGGHRASSASCNCGATSTTYTQAATATLTPQPMLDDAGLSHEADASSTVVASGHFTLKAHEKGPPQDQDINPEYSTGHLNAHDTVGAATSNRAQGDHHETRPTSEGCASTPSDPSHCSSANGGGEDSLKLSFQEAAPHNTYTQATRAVRQATHTNSSEHSLYGSGALSVTHIGAESYGNAASATLHDGDDIPKMRQLAFTQEAAMSSHGEGDKEDQAIRDAEMLSLQINDERAAVTLGSNSHFYCGRTVRRITGLWNGCSSCGIRCGPDSGCNCCSCHRLDLTLGLGNGRHPKP